MYRFLINTPSNKRVLGACLLSFATLMAPLPFLGNVTVSRAETLLPNVLPALSLTVDATSDDPDIFPDGICEDMTGRCTLRAAIQEANNTPGDDTITFSLPVNSTITRTAEPEVINSNLTIVGPATRVTVSGDNQFRVFTVAGGTVSISNLTIANGLSSAGGGINNLGNLEIGNTTFTGNQAMGPLAEGGAVYSDAGTLTITNSTISGNSSDGDGGGLLNCGSSTATLVNVTITDNMADFDDVGGGSGGGIKIESGTVDLKNTIVAGNSGGVAPDILGAVNLEGFNLIEDISGATITETANPGTNIMGQDPILGSLADNGGPTQTQRLLADSPAIDTGKNFAPDSRDQRGFLRPVDLPTYANTAAGDASDIGAYESQDEPQASFIVTTSDDHDDGSCTADDCTLREAILEANADPDTSLITFDIPGPGPHVIQLEGPLDDLLTDMNIQGDNLESVEVRGEGLYRIFAIFESLAPCMGCGSYIPVISISNLTITNGAELGFDGGGAIYNEGDLTIDYVIFTDNLAGFGGAIENLGSATISNSTFTRNASFDTGGAIDNFFGTITLNNSTFTDNQASAGGAIFNDGFVTINKSQFTDNVADFGGAALNTGVLNVEGSTFSRNHSYELGGAIENDAVMIIVNTTISGNTSDGDGGGLLQFQCGCAPTASFLTNVTITGNRADADGDASGMGGGIANIVDESGSLLKYGLESNPKLALPPPGIGFFSLRNTIVAANSRGAVAVPTSDDIDGPMDPESSYNLIGLGGSGGLQDRADDPAHGNQVGVANPGLGPLQDNGGPTFTHALLPGSPAFDAATAMTTLDEDIDDLTTVLSVVDASGIPDCADFAIQIDAEQMLVKCKLRSDNMEVERGANGTTVAAHSEGADVNPPFDQRGTGFPRVAFSAVDIGAFEVQEGPHHLAFGVQPSDTVAGAAITPAVTVLILDAGNNPTTSTGNVTLSIGTNAGGGALGGTTTVAAVNGTATFSNLSIDRIGSGYTLLAGSPGLFGDTSNPFNILSSGTVPGPSGVSGTKTKSGGNTPGSTVTYTVVLSNSGSTVQLDNAGDEFIDVLPSGLTLVSAAATSGTAGAAANTVTWNGSIPAGGSVTITITATINSGTALQTISNQGTINYDTNGRGTNDASRLTDDPAVGGDSDPTSFTVPGPTNVFGTKTKSGGNTPGSKVTYTVVLSNSGATAQLDNPGNEFTDPLPASLTLVSATATSGIATTAANTVNWNGSIPVGGSVTITITATINSGTGPQTISNQGTINYDINGSGTNEASRLTDDPAVGGASDPTSFTVISPANVSGTKTKAGGNSPGTSLTYTVILSNTSSSAQLDNPGNEFTDILPSGLTLVSASATSGTAAANVGTNTVSWNGSIAGNGSVTITITATINNVPDGTIVSNQGTINYDADGNGTNEANRVTDDPAVGGASDATSFAVNSKSDLTISKSHGGNFSGGQVGATYTIRVTNIGTGPTSGLVTVTDNVPVGLTPTGPNGAVNGWSCAINGQTVTCTRSDALAGGGASYPAINLTVTVANPAPLSVTNTATVSGGGDVNPNNNTASDPTTINCSPNFALNNQSPLMISRFRENGPAGPQDEFVEIFNPTQLPHTVASGNCGGGYGVYASAGNGTTSNSTTLVCAIPNGTVIPAGGYYLCTGVTYSLGNLGRNGGAAGATATGDAPIGCGGACGGNIPDDAGLVLINRASPTQLFPEGVGILEFGDVRYDRVGFGPYGQTAPAPGYPFLSPTYCEGGAAGCLKPVGDASTGAACANPTGQFPVVPIFIGPPACYGLAGQYEFLRRQTTFSATEGTLHQDTNNNGNDFILVSPNPATNMGMALTGVSGVTAVLGSAGPYNGNAPPDIPAVKLTRSPFDGTDQLGPRNLERRFIPDPTVADPTNNPLGTLTLRFKYTNNSGSPINGIRFEVDNLSTLCGPQPTTPTVASVGTGDARNVGSTPGCGTGSFTAILKALNSTSEIMVDGGGTAQFVNGTVMEDLSVGAAPGAGPLSPKGGGIDSTFIINPSSADASVGDGVTGGVGNFATTIGTTDPTKVIRMKAKFGVVRSGRFILLLVPMAKPTP